MYLILEKTDLKKSSENIDETKIEMKDFKKNCQDISKQFMTMNVKITREF